MNINVRAAAASDYKKLLAVFEVGDSLHLKNLPHIFRKPEGDVRERDFVLGLISDKSVGFFVAEVGDEIVGLICIMIKESPDAPIFVRRRFAVIDNVSVKKAFQRKGIGRALMEAAHDWALKKKTESIELNVWEFNRNAIAFYRALGFETENRKMSKIVNYTDGA
jgi:ribosomal protein S18 acetylase RimI-like enzyme